MNAANSPDLKSNISKVLNELLPFKGQLIAVTKTFNSNTIKEAFNQGILDFGESYIQESLEKIDSLKNLKIRWHYIGRVQSGNISKLVNNFYLIHSVFKIKHLKKINTLSLKKQKVLIQIKLDSDTRENGVLFSKLSLLLKEAEDLGNIDLSGLMFLPPPNLTDAQLANSFKSVKSLFSSIDLPSPHSWSILSMGMSNDYICALENGSTHVRLGTALFGQRQVR